MKSSEGLKKLYIDGAQKYSEFVGDITTQLFGTKVSIRSTKPTDQIPVLLDFDGFPAVLCSYGIDAEKNYKHILVFPSGFVSLAYAAMIKAKPIAQIGEEHLEGMREAINQIFGHILSEESDAEPAFTVDDLQLNVIESAQEIPEPDQNFSVIGGRYQVSLLNQEFTFIHYTMVSAEEQTAKQPSVADNTGAAEDPVGVHPVDFDSFTTTGNGKNGQQNIDMLMDVQLEVLAELGKKNMLIKDVLKLGKGSIVELDKAAGDPLELFVNGRKFAEGEVVVVDDHFGIRITQLLKPKDRLAGVK